MEKKFQTKCFDEAINKYLSHIESLWTSLPIVVETIESANQKAIIEHQEFLESKCEYIETENHYLITPENYRTNSNLKKAVTNTTAAIKIIKRNFLVSILSQFDTYIGDMMKAVFFVQPEIINNSEKQLTFADLSKFSNIESAKDYIIEKEIETILRESHSEQFKWFEKKLNIQLRKDLPIWQTFIEITQRRNLFVHGDGRVSTQYINVCKENNIKLDESIKPGSYLEVDLIYFDQTFKCLFEIGVKLNQVVRRNIAPEELLHADDSFLNISFELIQNRQYELAKILYDFSDKYIRKYSTEDLRLRILLNRAQTYKWLNQNDQCIKIIESEDWSASGDLFKLASYSLLDKYHEASEIMRNIGNNDKVINKSFYKDWPIFRIFRNSPEFKKTYFDIYKEEFEITEEHKREIQN